jgi:hypothetical protein
VGVNRFQGNLLQKNIQKGQHVSSGLQHAMEQAAEGGGGEDASASGGGEKKLDKHVSVKVKALIHKLREKTKIHHSQTTQK